MTETDFHVGMLEQMHNLNQSMINLNNSIQDMSKALLDLKDFDKALDEINKKIKALEESPKTIAIAKAEKVKELSDLANQTSNKTKPETK